MLLPRILTAIVGIPVILACIFYGGIFFQLMFFVVVLFSVMEFFSVTKKFKPMGILGVLTAVIFYAALNFNFYIREIMILSIFIIFFFAMLTRPVENISGSIALTCFGAFFITWSLFHMVLIRDIPKYGMQYIIFLFINVWLLDTGAYFVGKKFGRHKLASTISPKKTIEGAAAGVVTAVVVSVICRYVFMAEIITNVEAVIFGLVISFVGQFSDLAESLFKRDCNVKDSGNILPGHGGMLDRFDSYLFAAPVFYCLIQVIK